MDFFLFSLATDKRENILIQLFYTWYTIYRIITLQMIDTQVQYKSRKNTQKNTTQIKLHFFCYSC